MGTVGAVKKEDCVTSIFQVKKKSTCCLSWKLTFKILTLETSLVQVRNIQLSQTQSLSCRIHWLLLCREGVRCLQWVSWITILWWGSSNAGALGNVEYLFIAITPWSTLAWSRGTWLSPIYGSNRTKLCSYAKLNCLKYNCFWHWNCVLTLNWIIWYRTVLTFNSLQTKAILILN